MVSQPLWKGGRDVPDELEESWMSALDEKRANGYHPLANAWTQGNADQRSDLRTFSGGWDGRSNLRPGSNFHRVIG